MKVFLQPKALNLRCTQEGDVHMDSPCEHCKQHPIWRHHLFDCFFYTASDKKIQIQYLSQNNPTPIIGRSWYQLAYWLANIALLAAVIDFPVEQKHGYEAA